MYACPKCDAELCRVRRLFWERLTFAAVYRCGECGKRQRKARVLFEPPSLWSCCPKCGTSDLKVQKRRDFIEAYERSPLRRLGGLLGIKLLYCEGCRFQFHDFRPRKASKRERVGEQVA